MQTHVSAHNCTVVNIKLTDQERMISTTNYSFCVVKGNSQWHLLSFLSKVRTDKGWHRMYACRFTVTLKMSEYRKVYFIRARYCIIVTPF